MQPISQIPADTISVYAQVAETLPEAVLTMMHGG